MNIINSIKIAFLSLILLGSTELAALDQAQNEVLKQMEGSRAVKREQARQHVAENLTLTEHQETIFWPLYAEYQDELQVLNTRLLKLIVEYAGHFKANTIDDENGLEMLEQHFVIEVDRISLKRKYVKKFNAELPSRLVARFFHIDNKLDVLIKFGISKEIPLLPSE